MFEEQVYKLDPKYGKTDNEVKFIKEPRHGTWSVSFKRGEIPRKLRGRWTDLSRLKALTDSYLRNRKDNKAALGERVDGSE